MAVITTGAHPKALWPGIKAWYGRAYDKHPTQWTDLFEKETSDKKYEEVVESVGFGLAPIKPEGEPITYDTDSQGATSRFTHLAYALGFMITWEERRDNLYMEVSRRRSPDLAFSMQQTKETVHANIYNRGFSASYLGGDGKELFATDHPSMVGSQSNELSGGADLSETAIEDMVIQIRTAVDPRGRKIQLQPRSLHIHPSDEFEAARILKSILQNDTANNAINAIRATGALPEGAKVNQYFSDTDAWFIRTNCPWSMLSFERDPMVFDEDNDFDTKNLKYAAYERYSPGWGNWRGAYGSAGS
jgi:hypothetical protein